MSINYWYDPKHSFFLNFPHKASIVPWCNSTLLAYLETAELSELPVLLIFLFALSKHIKNKIGNNMYVLSYQKILKEWWDIVQSPHAHKMKKLQPIYDRRRMLDEIQGKTQIFFQQMDLLTIDYNHVQHLCISHWKNIQW